MLRDEIAKIIDEGFHPDYLGDCCCEYDGDIMVGKILALPIDDVVTIGDVLRMWENGDLVFKELHPELPALVELQRKAGLWDKVKEINGECEWTRIIDYPYDDYEAQCGAIKMENTVPAVGAR